MCNKKDAVKASFFAILTQDLHTSLYFMDYRYGSLAGLIILILDIIAIVEIFKSGKDSMTKLLWTLLILFFPLGGLLIYYFFGRGASMGPTFPKK